MRYEFAKYLIIIGDIEAGILLYHNSESAIKYMDPLNYIIFAHLDKTYKVLVSNIVNVNNMFESIDVKTKDEIANDKSATVVYDNAKEFVNILKTISEVNTEVTLKFNNESLSLRHLDPSRITMIDVSMPNLSFMEYNGLGNFGVDLEVLLKRLKNIDKEDEIKLEFDNNSVVVTLMSDINRVFKFKLYDFNDELDELPLPKTRYDVIAKLVLKTVNKIFRDIDQESFSLESNFDTIKFSSKNDAEECSVSLDKYDGSLVELEANSSDYVKSTYSVSYVKDYIRSLKPLTDLVTFKYATNKPLLVEIDVGHSNISFYLAPRIEA